MKNLSIFLLLLVCGIASTAAAPGGGSGGGSYGGDIGPSQPRKSPEQRAVEQSQRGVKYRDKGIAFELDALQEENPKKQQKLQKKAQKEYAKAQKRFERTLKTLPGAFEAHSDLGFVLRKQGQFDQSLAAYNKALALNPSYYPAIEYRGEAYLALNQLEAAKQAYMMLFREQRELADVLMAAMQLWLENATPQANLSEESIATFKSWVDGRLSIGQQLHDLSPHGGNSWQTAQL